MAPKKKSVRQRKLALEKPPQAISEVIEETALDIDHLNHLNGLLDSGTGGFRCTTTEMCHPDHSSVLLEEFSRMRQERFLTDLVLATKTKSFDVHKLVMASCSNYFRELLKSDPKVQRVELEALSPLGLATVITYAYMGKINLSLYTIGCTVSAATQLQIPQLLQMCTDFLTQEMTVENCMYISNIAGTYGLNSARDAARLFLRENFVEFSGTDHFLKLTYEQISELLLDEALQLPSEVTAFQVAVKWLEFDAKRMRHSGELLAHVRFGTISAQELVSHVQPVPCMMQNPECHRLLVDAMNYHLLPYQQNSLQSRRTRVRGGQRVLVTVGGRPSLTEKALSREILYRDPASKNWYKLSEMPAKSFNQCVAVMDGFLYVVGGEDQNDARNQAKHAVNSVCRYDPRFNVWLHLSGMHQRRTHFSLTACSGMLFAIGGRNSEGILSSMECYVPSSNTWHNKKSMELPRCCHSSTVVDGQILVTGGYINSAYSRTTCSYNPATDSWHERANLSTPRGWHCMGAIGDLAYVVGGSQLGPRGERIDVLSVECYNPASGQWGYVSPLPTGVSTAGLTTLEGRLYLLGGWNESEKKYKKCVQAYDPALNLWLEDEELPEATVGVSCCTITLPRPPPPPAPRPQRDPGQQCDVHSSQFIN
ncbi:KLH31 protein, partial [Polypterus senegalus]|nr:KLH31 protein [Polypterus senegalus]